MATLVIDAITPAWRSTSPHPAPGEAGSLSYEFPGTPACNPGLIHYSTGWFGPPDFFLGAAMKFATLHAAAEAIGRGLVTPVDLLEACLAAIDRLEPQVSAWVFVDRDRARAPGGSSSGSAAAVACGMCLAALASQTGGSVTRPASYCGVAGCKPTYGRVSADGVLPLAASMDHIGAIGRSVRDLALLLQVMAGPDSRDPLCSDRAVPDMTAAVSNPLVPRLGRVRGLF